MNLEKVVLAEKLARIGEHWDPKLVATLDDYDVKVVKISGDFIWHKHDDEDELFLVLNGAFRMDFRDRQIRVEAGEMIVVPKGSFTMGSPSSEPEHGDDESPQHKVTIPKDFAVGKFEVTFAEWDACVASGGCDGSGPEEATEPACVLAPATLTG